MGFIDYVLENYILIFEVSGLFLISLISTHLNDTTKRMTRIAAVLLLIVSIATYVELWTQSFEKLSLARPMLTALKYSLYPIVMILCMQIISPISKENKILFAILTIPATLSIPFYFTSQWTHIVCYFSNDNKYFGGPLRYLPYVIEAFYIIVFSIQNVKYLKNNTSKSKLVVIFILSTSVLGVILYFIFSHNQDYSPIYATALLLYYTFTYIYKSGTDSLTGLKNRQNFYQDAKHIASKKGAVVSIDMNDLKYFNDTYGHLKGDEALKTVAEILAKECGEHGIAYRIGGDEFEILYTNVTEKDVVSNINHMKECLKKTSYSCAFGYSLIENKSFHDALYDADQAMYFEKKKTKVDKHINAK